MITINETLFQDEYTGVLSGNGSDTGQSQLKGTVMGLNWISINCTLWWSTLSVSMKFDADLQTITRQDCGGGGSFVADGFKAGDEIVISGTGTGGYGYYDNLTLLIESVTASTIKATAGIVVSGAWKTVSIYGVPVITNAAMDFYYNLIANNGQETYNSPTDEKFVQKFTGNVPVQSASGDLLRNSTSWAWWDGYLGSNGYGSQNALQPTVTTGVMTGDYKLSFTIVFPFLIKPFYKSDQLQMIKDAFANSSYQNSGAASINITDSGFQIPFEFADGSSLKFIAQIDFRSDKNATAVSHTSAGYTWDSGNVAWFNMSFPESPATSNKTIYSLYTAATYSISGVSVDAIDYNQVTDVICTLVTSTSFVNSDPFVVDFEWLPLNSSVYQNYQASVNPSTYRTVFMHDRAYTTINAAGVNGDQYGTSAQVIKNVIGQVDDAGNLVITFSIDFASVLRDLFDDLDPADRNYKITITPQSQICTSLSDANRNSVICDVSLATTNTDETGLLVIITDRSSDTHYFRYPDVDTNPVTNIALSAGEMSYAKTQFKVQTGYQLTSINQYFQVEVIDPSLKVVGTFIIESWNNDVSGSFNGTYSDISINTERGYQLPQGDNRNIRSINRKSSLDGGGFFAYEIIYGFQAGYQFWINIDQFSEEFAAYHTQYWAVFTQADTLPSMYTSNIKFIQEFGVKNITSGNVTPYIHTSDVSVNSETGIVPSARVSTYDNMGLTLSGVVASDVETEVIVVCAGNGVTIGTPPSPYSDLIATLTFWYDDGTKQVFDTVTTEDDPLATSLWIGRPVINVIDPTSVTITGTIDATLVSNPIQTQRIFARLGYKI